MDSFKRKVFMVALNLDCDTAWTHPEFDVKTMRLSLVYPWLMPMYEYGYTNSPFFEIMFRKRPDA
jgi:hypothetical protein